MTVSWPVLAQGATGCDVFLLGMGPRFGGTWSQAGMMRLCGKELVVRIWVCIGRPREALASHGVRLPPDDMVTRAACTSAHFVRFGNSSWDCFCCTCTCGTGCTKQAQGKLSGDVGQA